MTQIQKNVPDDTRRYRMSRENSILMSALMSQVGAALVPNEIVALQTEVSEVSEITYNVVIPWLC